MKNFIHVLVLLVLNFLFFASNVKADCQGCCSWHGGVCCTGGVTMCCDGKPLSARGGSVGMPISIMACYYQYYNTTEHDECCN